MPTDQCMSKEDVVHIYNGILFSHKKQQNNAICSNMYGPRNGYTEWNKSDRERQILCNTAYMRNLKKGTNEIIYKAELKLHLGFPGGAGGKEHACQCRRHKRHRFDHWVGKIPWRRAQQPTPVFLLGESHGQRSLVGYSPWGRKEWDMTEAI